MVLGTFNTGIILKLGSCRALQQRKLVIDPMGRYSICEASARIGNAQSLDEISAYLSSYPESILSNDVTRTIMTRLIDIEKAQETHELNVHFLYTVCHCLATVHLKERNKEPQYINDRNDMGGYQILNAYYHILVACLQNYKEGSPTGPNPFDLFHEGNGHLTVYETKYGMDAGQIRRMIAIGFLFIRFNRWSVTDKRLWHCLMDVCLEKDFIVGFAQTGIPTADIEMVAGTVSGLMRHIDRDTDDEKGTLPYDARFMEESAWPNWMAGGWMGAIVRNIQDTCYTDMDPVDAEMAKADSIQLCQQLLNAYNDEKMLWHCIAEYALNVCPDYDIAERIRNVVHRYSQYFGDSEEYVADILNACTNTISKQLPSTIRQSTIFMTVERVIFDLMRKNPEVEPEVYGLFIRDICNIHQTDGDLYYYEPTMLVDAMMPTIREHFEAAKNGTAEVATENFTNAMEAMAEMDEDGYDDDLDAQPDDHDKNKTKFSPKKQTPAAREGTTDKQRRKTSAAFQDFKNRQPEVEKKADGAIGAIQKAYNAGIRTILLKSGKKTTPLGLFRKLCTGLTIFSATKIGFVLSIMLKRYFKKNVLPSERRKFIQELDIQISLVEERLEDARADGDREAKYELMRTLAEMKNTRARLQVGQRR